MKVHVADSAEYEELFADLCYNNICWGRVIYSSAQRAFTLAIFSPPNGNDWAFPLSEVQSALEEAKNRLAELDYG